MAKITSLADATRCYGIILGTERYDACLAFYRDTLGLPVWYENPVWSVCGLAMAI